MNYLLGNRPDLYINILHSGVTVRELHSLPF